MATQYTRNATSLAGRLPITGFFSIMTHLAAFLGGAYYKIDEDTDLVQLGVLDNAFPTYNIYGLQQAILKNRIASVIFTTIGLPFYLLLSVARTVSSFLKSVTESLILHLLTPFIAIAGIIVKGAQKNKGVPLNGLKEENITTSVNREGFLKEPQNPVRLLGFNKPGFRGAKLLTPTYQQRLGQTYLFIFRLMNIPHQFIDRLITLIDKNPTIRTISWVLFPFRLALSLISITTRLTVEIIFNVCEAVALPVVAIVHRLSLIKYKVFRDELKELTFSDVSQFGEESSLEELKGENTYKSILNNPHFFAEANFVINGHNASIEGGVAGVDGAFSILVTEENRGTLLKALYHDTFGWAQQLGSKPFPGQAKTQLDRALEVLSQPIEYDAEGMTEIQLSSSSSSSSL